MCRRSRHLSHFVLSLFKAHHTITQLFVEPAFFIVFTAQPKLALWPVATAQVLQCVHTHGARAAGSCCLILHFYAILMAQVGKMFIVFIGQTIGYSFAIVVQPTVALFYTANNITIQYR